MDTEIKMAERRELWGLLRLATLSYFMADRQLNFVIISVESLLRYLQFQLRINLIFSISWILFFNPNKHFYFFQSPPVRWTSPYRPLIISSQVFPPLFFDDERTPAFRSTSLLVPLSQLVNQSSTTLDLLLASPWFSVNCFFSHYKYNNSPFAIVESSCNWVNVLTDRRWLLQMLYWVYKTYTMNSKYFKISLCRCIYKLYI